MVIFRDPPWRLVKSKVCQIMWFGGGGGEQHPVSLKSSGTKEIETPTMAKRSGMGRFVPLGRSG